MKAFFNKWRFYGLGQDEYKKCMEKTFDGNVSGLRKASAMVAVVAASFSFFPLIVEKNIFKAGFYIGTAIVAILMYIFVRYKFNQSRKEKQVSNRFIYTLITLYYANIILFGIYLGVWANPGKLAGAFIGIIICALFLFNIPSLLHLCLTFVAMTIFITATIWVKSFSDWILDVPNAVFAGAISISIGWQIIKNRMSLILFASKMEAERDSYYDQSTIDELTQLRNRRDFMLTFQRYLSNYRQTDNFLYIAILDIDFFKNYNDYYGHPEGDECLRKIGKVLKDLQNSMNIYAARIGGEEFALLWFEEEFTNADNVASRINQMIHDLNIQHEKSEVAPYVTVSIGVHIVRCGTSFDIHALYDLADKALYTAKKNGRNRTVVSSQL
jgi:diguanylate cyclase (GGDEF)-like protein